MTRKAAMNKLLDRLVKYENSRRYLQQMLLPDSLKAVAKKAQFLYELMQTTGCKDYKTLPPQIHASACQKADLIMVSIFYKNYHQTVH